MKFDKSYFRDILKPYAGYVEQSAQRLRTLLDTDEPTPSVSRKILVDGPVAGTYSLALVNRHFALALMRLGFDVYLTQREGPDPKTDVYFQSHPELSEKYIDRDEVLSLSFDVHTKNDWPIQESPRLAPILTAHCYAWEESVFPVSVTSELAKFDAIFCTSQYAIDALRCSGYIGPTYYMGNGVEHIEPERTGADRKKPRASRGVHFVHVSSGMPRKGMREGLAAFFEEFRDDKDVHLTIKTHYSFDNELYELVRNLGPEERSKITFDDSYMSPGAIRDLIASADCCFLPSHGEGFCLPAAEAMRLRTLVCTTDSGGNREFCTPDTCILIPTRFAPSKTAIGQGRSAWLQASRSDLRAGLRRAYTVCKSSDQSLQRRAYHRIRKFTWTRATQNFIAGIDTLLMERPPVTDQTSKKRICLISTFNQRCGIAAYSEDLYATMKKADVASTLIISENIAQELITKPDDSNVLRLWERTGEGIDRLVNYTSNNEMGSHFIIQHHPAIFSWRELTRLCEGLKSGSGIVVVELHSTDGDAHQLSEFIEKTSRYARIIVHSGID
ncbi:glycosyltransferase [Methylobacterium sp. E-005]|uniref:glycosyltransferase family 4 protein n=1 Tax=Methylobacterium sp. E-005 TaxID=2836549 RepID=UPI001FBA43C5|nr:glycosyltransferase [Methylobacterium sp. E-005]MCJ2088834.1 glycosyltransferase [Methylobacterium sp. E-005]